MSFLPRNRAVTEAGGVWQAIRAVLAEKRLTHGQARVLLALLDMDGPELRHRPGRGTLAPRAGITHESSVGRTLESLVSEGWIKRITDTESGRKRWGYRLPRTATKCGSLFSDETAAECGSSSATKCGGSLPLKRSGPEAQNATCCSGGGAAPCGTDVQVDVQVKKQQQPPLPPKGGGDSHKASDIPFAKQLAAHADLAADDAFVDAWRDWDRHRREIKHRLTKTSVSKQLKTLAKVGPKEATARIVQSIEQGWQGLFEMKDGNGSTKPAESEGERNVRLYRESQA